MFHVNHFPTQNAEKMVSNKSSTSTAAGDASQAVTGAPQILRPKFQRPLWCFDGITKRRRALSKKIDVPNPGGHNISHIA